MKNEKYYVFMSLLLILFLSLGAVCASVSDDTLSGDNLETAYDTIDNNPDASDEIISETQENMLSTGEEN